MAFVGVVYRNDSVIWECMQSVKRADRSLLSVVYSRYAVFDSCHSHSLSYSSPWKVKITKFARVVSEVCCLQKNGCLSGSFSLTVGLFLERVVMERIVNFLLILTLTVFVSLAFKLHEKIIRRSERNRLDYLIKYVDLVKTIYEMELKEIHVPDYIKKELGIKE